MQILNEVFNIYLLAYLFDAKTNSTMAFLFILFQQCVTYETMTHSLEKTYKIRVKPFILLIDKDSFLRILLLNYGELNDKVSINASKPATLGFENPVRKMSVLLSPCMICP